MLLDMEPRTMQREMCFNRIIIVILVAVLIAFTAVFLVQQTSRCTDREHKDIAHGTLAHKSEAQVDVQRPSASLYMGSCSRIRRIKGSTGNLAWNESRVLHNGLTDGFTLEEDGEALVVPRSGSYRVSLQVAYGGLCWRRGVLSYNMAVFSSAYEENLVLLSSYDTINCKKGTWRKTLHSGDVFFLKEGDKLKVESQNLTELRCFGKMYAETLFSVRYEDG